jgi:peptide/nickel transport system substrate-binding protein
MDIDHRRLDQLRQEKGEIENHVLDEFLAGRLSRRDFLRRGAVVGLGLPVLGSILAACGSSSPSAAGGGGAGGSAATIRVGIVTPTSSINPVTVSDQGGLDMLGQTGEYLCLSDQTLTLQAVLATRWRPDATGSVWTFDIRKGVKFHDGSALTADDVVYTYKLHSNKANGSNALSAFTGVLVPDGVVKVDDYTVAFHLVAPNGSFPYLCSSDNYNMIILPNGYDPSKWESSFIGTGPFVKTSYTPKVGANFARNEGYWGTKARPAATQFTFYQDQTPEVLAMQASSLDVIGQFAVQGGEALLAGGYNVINLPSSAHRELSMRCDQKPFTDPRVRQAIALSLPRPEIVLSLFSGYASIGNDSPFASVFPSTDKSVPQRVQDLTKAKQLLSAAGYPSGFTTQLITEQLLEMPDYAQIIKASAAKIGVTINLTIETSSAYYGKAVYGQSDWLDATMSLVDYGHRGVPNVFLTAPLESDGPWNAAHFKDSGYDSLVAKYVAAVDVTSQKAIAGEIETLLLTETPVIYGYFYNYLTATLKNVGGAYPTAIGHIFLYGATKV